MHKEVSSVVQLVNLDLDFLKLLEELLQVHFAELDPLSAIQVLTRELFKVALHDILVVFASLLICLKVKCNLTDGCSNVPRKDTLLTGSRMIKHCMARL